MMPKFIHISLSQLKLRVISLLLLFLFSFASFVFAETKVFSEGGDKISWTDKDNWFPVGVPGLLDALVIDTANVTVSVSKDFKAKSVTVGGKTTSSWTSENFVYGTISPATTSEPAILIRKGGTVVFKGAGTITLTGSFKNSEESLPSEPSVMILLE